MLTSADSTAGLGLLLLGLLAGLLLSFTLFGIISWSRRNRKSKPVENLANQMIREQASSEAVFADLDIGLLAYGTDQRLILSNKAASALLGQDVPEHFDSFLTQFGEENGLKARLLLAKGTVIGQVTVNERVINILLRSSRGEGLQTAAYVVLLQDITDQELQEKQRKEFVANVSHELKTPLTTIITYSESLLDWGLDEKHKDGIRKDLTRIHDDAIRMQGLVTDLLLLSSIDSRKMQNRMEPLDFSFVVKQTVDRMQVQAKEKQIRMQFMEMAKLPPVFGDRFSLERIVSNLISNAIKYTDRKGEVKIYVGKVMDSVYVKVTDTGSGIEEKHLGQIFNRFYRVDMTGSRMYGGTGLGLSIAKELVALHFGQISVQSSLGQGSSFTVMLPSEEKVYCDTLTDVRSNVPLRDEQRIAAARELVTQLNERGESIDTLAELSDSKLEELIGEYSRHHKSERSTS